MMMIIPLLVKKIQYTLADLYFFCKFISVASNAPRIFNVHFFLANPLNCKLLEKDRKRETGSKVIGARACVRACLPRV